MKINDIVELVVDGQTFNAKVENVCEGQDYIDVRILSGGAQGNVAYQTVSPESEGSARFFRPLATGEQKVILETADDRREQAAPPPGTQPAGTIVPDQAEDLTPGVKPKK